MGNRPKILYITSTDASSRNAWSGTHYYIWKALEKNVGSVTRLGPVVPFFETWIGKIATGLSQKLLHKRYNYRHSYLVAKGDARIVNRFLAKNKFDLVVIPATSTFIPYLKTDIPIIYIGDSTVVNVMDYYKALTKLYPFSKKETVSIESMALKKASLLIYSSEWAVNSAIKDFGVDPKRVFMISFAANLDEPVSREIALKKREPGICTLLFVGKNWADKGGDIAYKTMLELNKMGVNTRLVVCGCVPPNGTDNDKMKVYPYLDKQDPEQQETLKQLFLEASFFLLPTKFDCTPIVFCEAFSFGLPVVAPDTGGISSVVTDNVTGCLLPHDADELQYAKRIHAIFMDERLHEHMRDNCRSAYERIYNWDSWADGFINACRKTGLLK